MTEWKHIMLWPWDAKAKKYDILTKPGLGIIGFQTIAAAKLPQSTKTTGLSKAEAMKLGQVLEDWREKQEAGLKKKKSR
jgi:hypothetical protein